MPSAIPLHLRLEVAPKAEQDESDLQRSETIGRMTHDMRNLVKKIQELRHLGIEDNKIALPKICVVGDQSTGKSSLIEGMSEIKVPRSAGTCTRCPMEINLSESNEPWRCKVSLSKSHYYCENLSLRKISKAKPLGPWVPMDPQEEHFITLENKDQVQEAIQCAQLAVLNPQNDPSSYVPGSFSAVDKTSTRVKFSPNVVRLDISAPGFSNLAFYDLPGVISQAEVDEEAYLVTLVENLVKHYVLQESCIILLTLPMTDDATNSSAARIVREIKATQRTLGVLTKPDRMEDTTQWCEILTGNKFVLGHGYFVIRNNPNPAVDNEQARVEEELFFSRAPWTTDLGGFQEKLGTRKLQTALSQLLLDQIRSSLPNVVNQINEKAERIKAELQLLPQPVTKSAIVDLVNKLRDFQSAVELCFDGGSKDSQMLRQWDYIASDFRLSLQHTRPSLKTDTEEDTFKEVAEDGNDDGDCEIVSVQLARTPNKSRTPASDTKPSVVSTQAISQPKTQFKTEYFDDFKVPKYRFQLPEIRRINESYSYGHISNQNHPRASETLNKISVSHWDGPMEIFLDHTNKLVRSTIVNQVNKVFAPYQETELHRHISSTVSRHLSQLKKDLELQALELLNQEKSKPLTTAFAYIQAEEKKHYENLTYRRRITRAKAYLKSQNELPEESSKATQKAKQIDVGPDPFDNEIKMMAGTRAYYDIASTRFVDSLAQKVHLKLFRKCNNLCSVIEEKLQIHGPDAAERCARLMDPNTERRMQRERLVTQLDKLTIAQQWLSESTKKDDVGEEDKTMVFQ
ncbi:hypothetical protein PISL3812_01383 [Talaromyces islandicus]|uniref:Interferon-induced GTP-binding protein Mx n=1 Tax=Talaromyces islandicus TaxID=28573 RepID=A0A0U1LLZ0_TALIS|nr:hypothetical protein PISL3812_01383 [Talaromyces islandicus]